MTPFDIDEEDVVLTASARIEKFIEEITSGVDEEPICESRKPHDVSKISLPSGSTSS